MFFNLFIIALMARIHISSAQEPRNIDVSQLGSCNEENYERLKLVKDTNGDEVTFVCSLDNGVYDWKRKTIDGTNNDVVDDVAHDIMDDVMLKREAATEFYDREPRNLYHECYAECCSWEEVRESYKHNIPAGKRYWKKFQKWKSNKGCTRKGWSW